MKKLSLALALTLSFSAFSAEIPDKSSFGMIMHHAGKFIFGKADLKGHTFRSLGKGIHKSWKKLDREINQKVSSSQETDFLSPNYQHEFNLLTQSLESSTSQVEFLVDGESSFAKRKSLIENAQESINLMVWAIYDDLTGKIHSDWLLESLKRNPHLKIRILVDGPTSKDHHHHQELNRLMRESNNKIEVVQWFSKIYRANGSHRKLFIVDSKHLIMGGLNIGDAYSHLNPEVLGWRDTDVYMNDGAALRAEEIFAQIWNEQIQENKLDVAAMSTVEKNDNGKIPVTLINHHPGSKTRSSDANILMAYSKLIRDAKVSVDIENAYFILNPVLRRSLKDALNRGVKIRLFTNSGTSIDEPVVSAPVLKSAKEALGMGVEVFLRKTTTLHSKFMIIDNKVALIGSDNLHPRSQKYEGEVVSAIFDRESAQKLTAIFNKDISEATQIHSADEIVVKSTLISKIASLMFFDQL